MTNRFSSRMNTLNPWLNLPVHVKTAHGSERDLTGYRQPDWQEHSAISSAATVLQTTHKEDDHEIRTDCIKHVDDLVHGTCG